MYDKSDEKVLSMEPNAPKNKTNKEKYIVFSNIMRISQNTSNGRYDGFPIVLVFFDITNRAINLLKP